MWFVVIGTLLAILKFLEVGPFANLGWLWVLLPFPCAMVWWWWADVSGFTKRREMEKMEAKKAARREKHLQDLGLDIRGRRGK